MKYFYLIFSSLKRKKLRTALTILSIMVAFILFGYLTAIRQAFDAGVEVAGADRLIVRHKVSLIQLLPESYEAKIERIDGVDNAAHSTWFGGIYQEPKNFLPRCPSFPKKSLICIRSSLSVMSTRLPGWRHAVAYWWGVD